jgi:hypothetical protein
VFLVYAKLASVFLVYAKLASSGFVHPKSWMQQATTLFASLPFER